MVTRLLGLTMAASLIEAYCCPARLTYPSVKSLWSAKSCPRDHHGNLQHIYCRYCIFLQLIQVSSHCPAKTNPKDHHDSLQHIYTLAGCLANVYIS